jgi:hypothetical protein
MRLITEHLNSDRANRHASIAGEMTVVHREAVGVTYWYAVPNELPRILADVEIDEFVRGHLMRAGRLVCRRCALPLGVFVVGEYHWNCVPVDTPADPTLFEAWPA